MRSGAFSPTNGPHSIRPQMHHYDLSSNGFSALRALACTRAYAMKNGSHPCERTRPSRRIETSKKSKTKHTSEARGHEC